jgi:hypothetical protein
MLPPPSAILFHNFSRPIDIPLIRLGTGKDYSLMKDQPSSAAHRIGREMYNTNSLAHIKVTLKRGGKEGGEGESIIFAL